jgi:hypothetical protein
VAKVKKRAGLTGVRNVKAGKATRKKARVTSTTVAAKTKRKGVKSAKTARKPVRKAAAKLPARRTPPAPPAPVVHARVRELDPQQKCGTGTSVQLLYRVDQTVDGRASAHLVFFDRHGWYCEHGRTCPAVAHARKHNGQFARASR